MKTEIITINSKDEKEKILKAAEVIRTGGLCVIPTETVYGLGANALLSESVDGIFKAKNRPSGNPLTVHICDFSDLDRYSKNISEKARLLAERFMPGPITLIVEKSEIIPYSVTAGAETVGLRMPSDDIAREIIRGSGVPVVATSANISGSLSPTNVNDVISELSGRVDCIVDGGEPPLGIESTVIDMTGETPKILRLGVLGVREIRNVIGKVEFDEASAPSGNLKHYGLNKEAVLIKSSLSDFIKYTKENGENTCVLCFSGEEKNFDIPCVSYGSEKEPRQLAKKLFSALRALNALPGKTAFLRCPSGDDSVSLAVKDHLLKTAGGNIIFKD